MNLIITILKDLFKSVFTTKNKTEDNLKLERSKSVFEGYRCDLTKELDDMSGISKQHYYNMFHHYIY